MTRTVVPPLTLMTSPDDAETQFYEAMQQGDIDRMMAVWADDDDITCVHPAGPRVVGAGAIRAAFEAMFSQGAIDIGPSQVRRQLLGAVAIHHVLERVRLSAGPEGLPQYGYILVTNVYTQTPQGWRLLVHHASPGSTREQQEITDAPPGTLH